MATEDTFLLEVEDPFPFQITGRGLVVDLLDIPYGFRNFSSLVRVERPEQSEIRVTVQFYLTEFHRPGKLDLWMIEVRLPEATKETVPLGSKLFVSAEDYKKLKGEDPERKTPPEGLLVV